MKLLNRHLPDGGSIFRGNSRKAFSVVFLIILVLVVFAVGCSTNRGNSSGDQRTADKYGLTDVMQNSMTETSTNDASAATQTSTISSSTTPTPLGKSSYRYLDPTLNLLISTFESTQGPVTISSIQPAADEFLYQDAIVTIQLADEMYVLSYLNLDDLNNNSPKNSDIVIKRTVGSGGSFYSFRPANNALYYYSDQEKMDFFSCIEHFPLLSAPDMDEIDYLFQGKKMLNGKAFCVITNEGRMAVIQYKMDSIIYNKDYTQDLSVIISVYNRLLE